MSSVQNGHIRLASLRPSYLPVSIRRGATHKRNFAKADRCVLGSAGAYSEPFLAQRPRIHLPPKIEVAMGGVPAVLLAFVFDKDAFYSRNDWIY